MGGFLLPTPNRWSEMEPRQNLCRDRETDLVSKTRSEKRVVSRAVVPCRTLFAPFLARRQSYSNICTSVRCVPFPKGLHDTEGMAWSARVRGRSWDESLCRQQERGVWVHAPLFGDAGNPDREDSSSLGDAADVGLALRKPAFVHRQTIEWIKTVFLR